jgi:AP-1-like transcription factor
VTAGTTIRSRLNSAMSRSDPQYHLSPNQQDLLVAALASNQPSSLERPSANSAAMSASEKEMDNNDSIMQNRYQNSTDNYFNTSAQTTDTPGRFPLIDDSPYLGFDPNADGDDQLEFDSNGQLIDDFAGDASQGDSADLHEKRKSFGDKEDDEEGGGKRRESEGALGKKPGRKPLTAEPTSVSRVSGILYAL